MAAFFRDARVPVVALAAALLALTIWSFRHFARYQPFADFNQGVPDSLGRVSLQIQNAVVTGREAGRRRWQVACRTITFSRDRRQASVDDIKNGRLYDDKGRAVVNVQAGHAEYVTGGGMLGGAEAMGGTLRLSEGIRADLLSRLGLSIQSDTLTWDSLHNQIECPGDTHAMLGKSTAIGTDIIVDTRTGDFSMRALHGTFVVPTDVQQAMFTSSPRTLSVLGGAFGLMGAAHAAPPPPTPSAPAHVDFASGFSRWINAPSTAEMSQGVTFNQGDAFMKTQVAVVNLDDQQQALNAKSQSTVHLYDPQDDLTGKQGYIDFTTHVATLTGNVVLVVKPGKREAATPAKSVRHRFQDPATLTCSQLTYDYKKKIARVPGPLTVHSGARVLTADSGEYDAGSQTVRLVGHVHGTNGKNEINAPHATIGVDEGSEYILIDAPTHGTWEVKSSDEDAGPPPTHSTAPPITPLPMTPPASDPTAPVAPQPTTPQDGPADKQLDPERPLDPDMPPPDTAPTAKT